MRVAVEVGESAAVPAKQGAEREPPGQRSTDSATSGRDSERELASGRRREAQATWPGYSGRAHRNRGAISRRPAAARCREQREHGAHDDQYLPAPRPAAPKAAQPASTESPEKSGAVTLATKIRRQRGLAHSASLTTNGNIRHVRVARQCGRGATANRGHLRTRDHSTRDGLRPTPL